MSFEPYSQNRKFNVSFRDLKEVKEVNNYEEANEYLKKGYHLIYLTSINKDNKTRVMVYILGK